MTSILVVDNYDSFVFNLVQYLGQLGAHCDVRRNDEVFVDDALGYDGVLLSPGPGTPESAGVCIDMVKLPDPFTATRYHSLAIAPESLPAELVVTATTQSGVIMGVRHRSLAIEGVQFHPESVLTQGGHLMLANWLVECGKIDAVDIASGLAPVIPSA